MANVIMQNQIKRFLLFTAPKAVDPIKIDDVDPELLEMYKS
jgi:hypothetical protein